ncbi:origin recognition complex subunit 3 N-terminus-domain-containing protein [Chytriomyces sp. MP71]|nr:origin recognition complex subunit 3 N-terminus-domain-containing protein [Chytriomyces sp. MP71]
MQPRERNSTGIVVSIPDFERFDNAVFSHLVKVCSSCMEEMPFTFLLGISTTLDILHNNYDKSVIRLLRCERFNLSKSDESVDAIISEIFLKDPCGIKLDHDAFSQVFSNYWHNHKSLDALGDALEFTLMTHLYGNAHSVCMTDENSGSVYYPELLNRFRWMQSYQDYVNDIAKKEDFEEVERLTNDDYHLIALIEKSKLDLLEYHAFQVLGVELLRSTKRLLKLNNLNSLYFAYSSLLSTYDFVQEKVVQEVVRRLKAIKVSELISIVIHWIQALESYESPLVHSTPPLEREIAELKAHIATFESKHKPKLRDFDDSDSSDEEARIRANEKHVPTSARKTRSAQKAGLEMPLFVEKGGLMFFAASVAGSFERILRKLTKHYTSVLFHEIYYYRDYKLLIKAFQPQPRPIIQMALGAPSDYLACRCCEANAPLNSNSLDMSIVYRLHQECGHMINLFDLFTAFELVVGKEKPTPSRTSLQARFSACLTQLEFLGFIKPTMRKTDHVLKMTASFL